LGRAGFVFRNKDVHGRQIESPMVQWF
jgi:hypothetical protein